MDAAKHEVVKQETAEQKAVDPQEVKKEAAEQEPTKPEAVKQETVQDEATNSEATKSEATKPEAVEQQPVKQEAVKHESHSPDDTSLNSCQGGCETAPDNKPVIPGVAVHHLTFEPTRKIHYRKTLPGEVLIKLFAISNGITYDFKLCIGKDKKVEDIKNYLVKYYNYEFNTLRLIYDGFIVQNDQTLEELDVHDNGEFDVFFEQFGGSPSH